MHTFEVQVDSDMMRQAWNAWFFKGRRMGRLAFACLLLLGGMVMDATAGQFGTMSVIAATVLGLTLLVYTLAYFLGVRRALAKQAAIVDGKASYTLKTDAIEAKSSLGSVSLVWSAIAEVRWYQDLILLGFRGAAYSTIPAKQIPEAALAFLVERARTGGAKIVQLGKAGL